MKTSEAQAKDKFTPPEQSSIIIGAGVLIVLFWAMIGTFLYQSHTSEKILAKNHMYDMAERLSLHTTHVLKNIDLALFRLISTFERKTPLANLNSVETTEDIITAFSSLEFILDVAVSDPTGNVLYSHRFDYINDLRENFKEIIESQRLIKRQRLQFLPGKTMDNILAALPVLGPNKSLLGYIFVRVNTPYLKKIYQAGLRNDQYAFSLFSSKRKLFSIPVDFADDTDIPDSLFGGTSTPEIFYLESPDYLSALKKVLSYDLVIKIVTDKKMMLEQWYEKMIFIVFIGLFFTVVIFIFAYFQQRALSSLVEENQNRLKVENELRKLSVAVEQSPVSILITDIDGKIEYANPRFSKISGYSNEELIGQDPKILSSGAENMTIKKQDMWDHLKRGRDWRGQFHNKRKDGSHYWESALISPIKNDQGEIINYIAVKEDITQRKIDEEQLQLAAAVFETATEAILICDASKTIEMVNTSFTDITGYSSKEAIGQTPAILKSGHHDEEYYRKMHQRLEKYGKWSGEIWNRRKNGEIYPQWLSITTIRDEKGEILRYISLFSDITIRKQDEERIRYQANYDALTNLPNRSLFLDRLDQALERNTRSGGRFALMFIDLDRFKAVNDTLGHAYGDILLKEAARRLTSCVRKSDTIARLGGDEFTVILQDLEDSFFIEGLLDKLLTELSSPFDLDGNISYVSASIGVTFFPDDGRDVETLLQNADTAMYRAKDKGRNVSQFYTLEMNHQAQEHRKLEKALHQALEREEFALHYQPIVDSRTGKATSCEALLRWIQPEHGNVYPDRFIPLAEETGLIVPIGDWAFREACLETLRWLNNNPNAPGVSVNMSSRQFQRKDVVTYIKDTITELNFPPEKLTVEITESLLVEDDERILEQLRGVRDLGIGLSIDDFGTGYSSLSYLRRFPITTIKIDRAFIMDVTCNDEAAALVGAILSMAKSLKLKVVAEGVETAEQFNYLKEKGCEYIQGYYFSRPLPNLAFRQIANNDVPLQPED